MAAQGGGMGFQDLIKFQMLSMMGIGMGGMGSNQAPMTMAAVCTMMFTFMMISFVEEFTKRIPQIVEFCKRHLVSHSIERAELAISKVTNSFSNTCIPLEQVAPINTIFICRQWEDESEGKKVSHSRESSGPMVYSEAEEIGDAVLHHIATLSNVPSLQLNTSAQYIINYVDKTKLIEILPSVYIRIDSIDQNQNTQAIVRLVFRITSDKYSTKELKEQIGQLHRHYVAERQNQLGTQIYFFDQKLSGGNMTMPSGNQNDADQRQRMRMERILRAPPSVTYEMRPFFSNKYFTNLYGPEAELIQKRVEFFIRNPDWYKERGIPHQLGILLSGMPGSGKTAMIRAIANATRRHIINLKLSDIATATQLKDIFYNEYIQVTQHGTQEVRRLHIPTEKRIYVLEEIDTVGSLIYDRGASSDSYAHASNVLQNELTLGDILQILDGTIEMPSRILVVTSNYPERLDRALLRPGRIDVKVQFGKCPSSTVAQILKGICDIELDPSQLPDHLLTAAEVVNVAMEYNGHALFGVPAEETRAKVMSVLQCHIQEKRAFDEKQEKAFEVMSRNASSDEEATDASEKAAIDEEAHDHESHLNPVKTESGKASASDTSSMVIKDDPRMNAMPKSFAAFEGELASGFSTALHTMPHSEPLRGRGRWMEERMGDESFTAFGQDTGGMAPFDSDLIPSYNKQ